MPTFIYQAKNEKGQIVSGTVEAENERQATQTLWENKLKVILLEPKPIVPAFRFLSRVPIRDKAIFARQLSTMISAGIHLVSALKISGQQTRNKRLKEVLDVIIKDIEGGYSFSTAISKHPDAFDRVFVSVVRSGEASGKLDQVLLSLADRMEKDAAFRGEVKMALIYPIFLFCAIIVVGSLMMIKVIPQIKDIFETSNVQLPWQTRALIFTSNFLSNDWWIVLLGLIVIYLGIHFYLKTETGSRFWSNFIVTMPLFGGLNKTILMARFNRTFSLLIQTGIPILEAIHIVAETMDNDLYKRSLYQIASEVERGVPMSIPISREKNFPPIIGQMVGVGEQTGTLDQILDRLGVFYENEVEERTKNISSLIEPVVIVILGIGVGILVFSILIPIYQIAQIQ